MKKLTLLFAVTILACSCSKSYYYKYTMVKPIESDQMSFADKNLDIQFKFGLKSIGFKMKNKTDSLMKITWDETALVFLGKSQKLIHNGEKYSERNATKSISIVLPNTNFEDDILPTENVDLRYAHRLNGKYGGFGITTTYDWYVKEMFPKIYIGTFTAKKDMANCRKLIGEEITFYLPLLVKNKPLGYYFTFKIVDILQK